MLFQVLIEFVVNALAAEAFGYIAVGNIELLPFVDFNAAIVLINSITEYEACRGFARVGYQTEAVIVFLHGDDMAHVVLFNVVPLCCFIEKHVLMLVQVQHEAGNEVVMVGNFQFPYFNLLFFAHLHGYFVVQGTIKIMVLEQKIRLTKEKQNYIVNLAASCGL